MARVGVAKLALARAVGAMSRLAGRGGTSAPGKVLLRLDGRALSTLSSNLPRGSVVLSATNGKTTTATMLATIVRSEGVEVVHNAAGANMAGGVATALLAATGALGSVAGELGLFEVDEAWLPRVVDGVRPRVIVLGNLFRDQLDRYGELETLATSWSGAVSAGAGSDGGAGAERGRSARGGPRARIASGCCYFGVEDDSLALPELAHAADAKHCRRCGAPYVFDVVYLGHLGHYQCPACGQRGPRR